MTDHEARKIVRRRLEELRSGKVKPIPGDEVFEKVWKHLNVNPPVVIKSDKTVEEMLQITDETLLKNKMRF